MPECADGHDRVLAPFLDLLSLRVGRKLRHFPKCKNSAKKQGYEREQDCTQDLNPRPLNFLDSPLAAFIEVDYSHHGPHLTADDVKLTAACTAAVSSEHSRSINPIRGQSERRRKGVSSQNIRRDNGIKLERNRKDALAANGRRASKEGGMPIADNRVDLKRRRGCGRDPDQQSRDHHDQKGHDSVHHDANLAVVRVGVDRMRKRYVHNRQQHQ
jgi:hypothetical protein